MSPWFTVYVFVWGLVLGTVATLATCRYANPWMGKRRKY